MHELFVKESDVESVFSIAIPEIPDDRSKESWNKMLYLYQCCVRALESNTNASPPLLDAYNRVRLMTSLCINERNNQKTLRIWRDNLTEKLNNIVEQENKDREALLEQGLLHTDEYGEVLFLLAYCNGLIKEEYRQSQTSEAKLAREKERLLRVERRENVIRYGFLKQPTAMEQRAIHNSLHLNTMEKAEQSINYDDYKEYVNKTILPELIGLGWIESDNGRQSFVKGARTQYALSYEKILNKLKKYNLPTGSELDVFIHCSNFYTKGNGKNNPPRKIATAQDFKNLLNK